MFCLRLVYKHDFNVKGHADELTGASSIAAPPYGEAAPAVSLTTPGRNTHRSRDTDRCIRQSLARSQSVWTVVSLQSLPKTFDRLPLPRQLHARRAACQRTLRRPPACHARWPPTARLSAAARRFMPPYFRHMCIALFHACVKYL